MALRKIIFASIFASTPLSAIGQNLDASDLLNLGNQILKGIQQPQATTPQQAPVTPEIRTETRTVPAYSRSEVSEIQALLVQLGYDPGVVDGVMGNRTSNAIRQFQAAQGLPQTGQPSPGLLVRLRSFAGTSGAANTGIVESVSGSQAITPSFDCGRATTAVELAICSSAELAALDKRLDAIYRNALQPSQDRNGLVADQRAWLDKRNRCNANAVCIRSALVHRIDDLGKLAASDGRTVASPSPVIPALELETPRTDGSATAPVAPLTPTLTGDTTYSNADAYDYLLATYVRQHPELTTSKEFLAKFAGWNCSSRSYYRKTTLNPFEVQEAMKDAAARLADLVASSPPNPPSMIETELKLSVADYDFERGAFPINSGFGQIRNTMIGDDDYCHGVAKSVNVLGLAGFPMNFEVVGPDGLALDAQNISALVGDLKMSQADAKEFYAKGFPTVVITIRGPATETSPPGSSGAGVVRIVPRQITFRTQGNAQTSRILAVFGPDEITLPDVEQPALTTAVALVAPANIAERASVAMPVCLEPPVAESVRPLAAAAVGKSLEIAKMNTRVRDAMQYLVGHDDIYLLVGGDCIEQIRFAIERDYSGAYDEVSFTQLVAAQAENTALPTNVAVPAADLNISTERLPLTRLYLSQYLNQVPREMRIEKFKKYIGYLAAHPTETPVLSRDEVNGRNPEFVANSAIGHWDDALQSLSLAPPVSVVASVDLSRGNYDFARGVMTFPNAPATEVDGKRYLSDGSGLFAPLPDSQKQQVTRTEDLLLWFLQDQITPDFMKITLDRMVPMPEIAMTAERAEQFILSEMRTIAELHYSIDEISPLTESRVLGFDGTLIGARVFTDTGDDLIAWTPDQLPLVAVAMPAPEPEAPVAGSRLARPRDIIAAVAQSTGRDRAELIGSLYPPTSQDSFARRDEIEMLASTAEPVELGGFWMTGNGRYSEYDFATQTFGFDYLNLGYSNNLSRNEGGIKRDKLFRLTNVDDYGIRFPMTEDEAQRLQQAAGGSDAIYRALIVADPPERADGELGLPMEARVAEIVVLRPGSDPQMEFKSDILARIAFASGSEAVIPEVAIASEAVPAGAYDILDVRIRQALDTVLPAIEASFLPETVIYGRREVWVDQQNLRRPITLTTPLSEATILVRDGGGDSLTIFHEPLLPDNPVTGIARTISFAEGTRPAPDAVMAVLVDKYGDMATQQKYAFDWFRATPLPQEAQSGEMSTHEVIQQETAAQMATAKAFRCKQLLSGITGKLDYDAQSLLRTGNSDFNFSPYPVVDDGNATISLLATDPLWSINRVDVSRPECDEDIVLAAIEPDSNGLVSVLRVLVTNRGYLAEIEAQAKQALINMNTSETGVKPEIKL